MRIPNLIKKWHSRSAQGERFKSLYPFRFHRFLMALKAMQLTLDFAGAARPHPRDRGLVPEKRKDKNDRLVTRWVRPPGGNAEKPKRVGSAKPKGEDGQADLFGPRLHTHTPAFKSRFAAKQWVAVAPDGTEIHTPDGVYGKGDKGWTRTVGGVRDTRDDAWAASTLHTGKDVTVRAAEGVPPPSSSAPSKPFQAHPKALEEAGFRRWTTIDGHDRWYAPTGLLEEIYGLKVHRYGTGNVSSATLDGSSISNSSARKILEGLAVLRLHWDAKEGRWGVGRGDPVNPNGEYSQHLVPELEAGLAIRGANLPAPEPQKQLYVEVPTFPTDGTAEEIAEWSVDAKPGTRIELSSGDGEPVVFKREQIGWGGPSGRIKLVEAGQAIHDHISLFGPGSVKIHAPKSHPTAGERHTTEPMVEMAPAPELTPESLAERREAMGQRKIQEAAEAERAKVKAEAAAEQARVAAAEAAERAKVQAAEAAEASKRAEAEKVLARLVNLPPDLRPENIKGRAVRISDPPGLPRGRSVTYRFKEEIKEAGGRWDPASASWGFKVPKTGAKVEGLIALAHKLHAQGAKVSAVAEVAKAPRVAEIIRRMGV